MNVALVVVLLVATIFLFKVAAEVVIAKKKGEHKCDCDGKCGDNCKCKDK